MKNLIGQEKIQQLTSKDPGKVTTHELHTLKQLLMYDLETLVTCSYGTPPKTLAFLGSLIY